MNLQVFILKMNRLFALNEKILPHNNIQRMLKLSHSGSYRGNCRSSKNFTHILVMVNCILKPCQAFRNSGYRKIRMKGDVLPSFSGRGPIEDTSSYLLSYYEQKLLFLSLRFGFFKSEKPPKKGPK